MICSAWNNATSLVFYDAFSAFRRSNIKHWRCHFMQSNPVFTLPWPPPLPPAAPAAGSVLCPPSLPQREHRGLAPPPLTHPCSLQPPPDRPPSAPCSTDRPMVGEQDGPGCGWCCWASLAKSGWHCAACAPVTADKARRKSENRQIDQKFGHIQPPFDKYERMRTQKFILVQTCCLRQVLEFLLRGY